MFVRFIEQSLVSENIRRIQIKKQRDTHVPQRHHVDTHKTPILACAMPCVRINRRKERHPKPSGRNHGTPLNREDDSTRNSPLARLRVVVQGNTHGATVVATVLADDVTSAELPQASVVVTGDGHEVGRIRRESAVPDPTLVVGESGLQEQGVVDWVHGRAIGRRSECLLGSPLAGRVVGDTKKVTVLGGGVEDAQQIAGLGRSLSWRSWNFGLGFRRRVLGFLLLPLLENSLGRQIISIEVPDLRSVIGRASRQVLHIRREQNTGEVVLVGLEGADRNNASGLVGLDHAPEVDVSLPEVSTHH